MAILVSVNVEDNKQGQYYARVKIFQRSIFNAYTQFRTSLKYNHEIYASYPFKITVSKSIMRLI